MVKGLNGLVRKLELKKIQRALEVERCDEHQEVEVVVVPDGSVLS